MVKIGSPFSPEMISLVQRKQEQDRAFAERQQERKSRAEDRRIARADAREDRRYNRFQGRQDSFLGAQFRASEGERDRDLRRELGAHGRADRETAFGRSEDIRKEERADRLSRESISRGDAESKEIGRKAQKKRELDIREGESKRKSQADRFKEIVERGQEFQRDEDGNVKYDNAGNPLAKGKRLAGGKAAGREATTLYTGAKTADTIANTRKTEEHIKNYWPEKIKNAKFKNELARETLNLKRMALDVKSRGDARRLAINVVGMFKDPLFGGFSKSNQAAMEIARDMMLDIPEAFHDVFSSTFQQEQGDEQRNFLESERQKRVQDAGDRQKAADKRSDMGDPAVRKLYGVSPKPNATGR